MNVIHLGCGLIFVFALVCHLLHPTFQPQGTRLSPVPISLQRVTDAPDAKGRAHVPRTIVAIHSPRTIVNPVVPVATANERVQTSERQCELTATPNSCLFSFLCLCFIYQTSDARSHNSYLLCTILVNSIVHRRISKIVRQSDFSYQFSFQPVGCIKMADCL